LGQQPIQPLLKGKRGKKPKEARRGGILHKGRTFLCATSNQRDREGGTAFISKTIRRNARKMREAPTGGV